VSSVADAWLAGKVKSTPSTAARNRGIVEGRIKPRWGAQRVGSVEHGEVQKWVADLVAEGLAPTTVRKIVFVLNGILKTAVKTRRVASNPCSDIELPTAKVKRRRYLTARELEALAKAAGEQGTAVYVLAYCGLRWGEMAALRVRAVDLLRGRLVIVEAVTEVDGALVWGAPKDHQRRTVPVPAFLRSLLEQTIEGKSAHDLVFVTSRGAVMRVRGASSMVRRGGCHHRWAHPARTAAHRCEPGGERRGVGPRRATSHGAREGIYDARRLRRPVRPRFG
jgi:integrase